MKSFYMELNWAREYSFSMLTNLESKPCWKRKKSDIKAVSCTSTYTMIFMTHEELLLDTFMNLVII